MPTLCIYGTLRYVLRRCTFSVRNGALSIVDLSIVAALLVGLTVLARALSSFADDRICLMFVYWFLF